MNDLLIRRRNAVIVSDLPLPYDAEVEYLRNTSTCWIDTGITGNVRIVGKAQETALRKASSVLVGSSTGATGGTWFGEAGSSQKWGLGTGTGQNVNIAPTTLAEFDITFTKTGASGTVNGVSLARTVNTNQGEWHIFSSGIASYPFRGDVVFLQFYKDNILVRDYIAVRVGTTGYLYDRVSRTLFGNANTSATTEFEYGNDIT